MSEKIKISTLQAMKIESTKITALTAYDYPFAKLLDDAGVDIILVGDSLGMAFRGEENTLKVTVDDIAYHTRAVKKGIKRALLIADMPFLSWNISDEDALNNAGALVAEGAEGVKLEGATEVTLAVIRRLVAVGIPVMGHVGLTPQSILNLGGFSVQGKRLDEARKIAEDAKALEEAGVFAVVLEAIPVDLAESVTKSLNIPTIGIGAGAGCDGQILVSNDLLGLNTDFSPKFVKKYADLADLITGAVKDYIEETKTGAFPDEAHSYHSPSTKLKAVQGNS